MAFDPYDEELKKSLHPLADEKNCVALYDGVPALRCGSKRANGRICHTFAGLRTDHMGYGRCYRHGGCNTGPSTPEGRATAAATAAVSARKHGLYSDALGEEERDIYERLMAEKKLSVIDEINMLKAKILGYLLKWQRKAQGEGEKATQVAYRVMTDTEDGERISEIAGYYHAGTAEDKILMRALQELGRLVDKQAKLSTNDGEDLLAQINQELRAASHGKVTLAWGTRSAQARKQKTE